MSVAGGKLKEEGTVHWTHPNNYATNSSGFTGLLGGVWNPNGYFDILGTQGYFWTSSNVTGSDAWDRALMNTSQAVIQYSPPHTWGLSLRCMKVLEN
jgi:uncharacterized protein (TIGR02145 family)